MSKLSPARKLALDVLMEADRRGMYARDVLSSRASAKAIDQRDSAFAARLALGVAATQGILDELLDQFLDKPKKVAPRVRMALRISAFEMLYLHTPGRVAVSQGVELVRSGAKSAAGLANAVLHKVADNVEDFATASDVDESERRLVRLSRLMGLPRWLCARIMVSFDTPEGALNFAGQSGARAARPARECLCDQGRSVYLTARRARFSGLPCTGRRSGYRCFGRV